MAEPKAPVYYDRTASEALRKQLQPKGAFGYLTAFVRKHHLADLQFRGYPHSLEYRATLYVGLTKVLDVYERNGSFWLRGLLTHQLWDGSWAARHPGEWFAKQPVPAYLEEAIRGVGDRFTHEGAVQAMLCTRASNLLSVVDREAVVGFADAPTKKAICDQLQGALTGACAPLTDKPWFVPPHFGTELDLLAIDDAGRLLVIEIKPSSTVKGIAWAPSQATFYARLFRRWADEVGASKAKEILGSMLAQRVELGLTRDPLRPLREPLEIVPVVAIGGPPSAVALERLRFVQERLMEAKVGDAMLEVWEVEEAVRARGIPLADGGGTSPWRC